MAEKHPEVEIASRFARHLTLLGHVERIGGLGSWEWTRSTGELLWSDNLCRLFGFGPGEIDHSLEFALSRVHPDDRARVTNALRAMTDGTSRGVLEADAVLEYRVVRPDGAVVALRSTVATYEGDARRPVRIIGAVQDVTLQRRLDRTLAAHAAVTTALDSWTSLEQGAGDLLARLAATMEFAFGAFWLPDGSTLTARTTWQLPSPALLAMAESTRLWRPGLGSATLGRAFIGRQPVILSDPSLTSPLERSQAAREAGLLGAIAVPAVAVDETLAVLELWSFEPIDASERLLRALHGIGHEIGHFLSRRRGELTAPALSARELEVLQLAAQGRSAAQIAATMHLSPAPIKRHFERAYAALDVSDRAAAVGEAMRRGLIE